MKKNNEKIQSKFWRFLVIIYFFVTIPFLFSVCIWLFKLSWTYLEYNRKYNDLDCIHFCSNTDTFCKKLCLIAWLENWLQQNNASNKYVGISIPETEKIYEDFLSKRSIKNMTIVGDKYKVFYYGDQEIEEFAKAYWYWNWHYDYIFGILYVCLALFIYIILTDVLRWAVYYIDIWEFKLYIFSKIKFLFKRMHSKK